MHGPPLIIYRYLYDREYKLKVLILEVNNTFDERHAYILCAAQGSAQSTVFNQMTDKKFHVSPFNDRSGRYKVIAHELFRPQQTSLQMSDIDVTVVLESFDQSTGTYITKFIANIRSTAPPLCANIISQNVKNTIGFAFRYGWVPLLTVPRILYQASVLWAVKKMAVYHKPEIVGASTCRRNTKLEW